MRDTTTDGGLTYAPVVGGSLSELALMGAFQSTDLTRIELFQVCNNRHLHEIGIK